MKIENSKVLLEEYREALKECARKTEPKSIAMFYTGKAVGMKLCLLALELDEEASQIYGQVMEEIANEIAKEGEKAQVG